LLVCLRAGIWNIGIDGQVVVGALACGVVAGDLTDSGPRALVLLRRTTSEQWWSCSSNSLPTRPHRLSC
jgi:ABC-type uncharacterized transport system permease subunit